MGNPVVHWELMSKQPERVAEFYAKIFAWKVDHRPQFNSGLSIRKPREKCAA